MTTGVFAIDTATEACSAAILVAGEVHKHFLIAPRRHSALILPMVEARSCRQGSTVLCFGRGPGLTGVRIATGVIKGPGARFGSARRAVERCQALL